MYEYLASVQSAVRRVNERIKTLSEKFGTNSSLINNIASKYEVIFGSNMVYKNGVPQLVKPSEIFNDEYMSQVLQAEDKMLRTWGSYRKQYEKEYLGYTVEQGSNDKLSMPDFIQTMQNISGALRDVPSDTMPSDALKIMRTNGRKKTYAELIDVYNILKKKGLI